MPESIKKLPQSFFEEIDKMSFKEISCCVAEAFFGDDIDSDSLRSIVEDTLAFECPAVKVEDNIFSLELFHGPTLAFKDVGARFMARMLQYFTKRKNGHLVNVLVATSGDTGSAVANGFLGVDGIHVYVLYPKGKVSKIQESQFTTLGRNITALEVDGVFDDCQRLVKMAFTDDQLTSHMQLTSANSINVARLLPQSFYYFNAYAQMKKKGKADNLVVCVPSGNFGNITAALYAQRMGLPIKRFVAANNANDVFFNYLQSGEYNPMPSKQTIANAMDVGNPSNFARIYELYDGSWQRIAEDIAGTTYNDEQIRQAMAHCYERNNYILDPHGACGYQALRDLLKPGETGIFCETAHPAKFKQTVEDAIKHEITIPERLSAFMKGTKQSIEMPNDFDAFKTFLLSTIK